MHELKQLIDNSLQEFPMGSQEPWVLSDHIHDVGGNDGLVVFAAFLLTEPKQILQTTQIP